MATLTGKITDVTGRAPDSISSITVKAPSARIGGGTDVIVSSPAKVTFDKTTGDITISGLAGGLSWLYLEGEGWSDSIALSAAEGMISLVEAIANASSAPGIIDYLQLLADFKIRFDETAQDAVDAAAEEIKWFRGYAGQSDQLSAMSGGAYFVASAAVATALNLPRVSQGWVIAHPAAGSSLARRIIFYATGSSSRNPETWSLTIGNDGTSGDWVREGDRYIRPLTSSDDYKSLPPGKYGALHSGTPSSVDVPSGRAGALEIQTTNDNLKTARYSTNHPGGADKYYDYATATNAANDWNGSWYVSNLHKLRSSPIVLTQPAGDYTISNKAEYRQSHRLAFTCPTNVERIRIHVRANHYRLGKFYGGMTLRGMSVGKSTGAGGMNTQQAIDGASGVVIPEDGSEWVSEWSTVFLSPGDTYLLSYSADWTTAPGTMQLLASTNWASSDPDAWSSTGTSTGWTRYSLSPLDIWIECLAPADVPVYSYFGTSLTMGMSSGDPVFMSYPQIHARNNGVFCAQTAAGGWAVVDDTAQDPNVIGRFGDAGVSQKVFALWGGSNDVNAREATVQEVAAAIETWSGIAKSKLKGSIYLQTSAGGQRYTGPDDPGWLNLEEMNDWIRHEGWQLSNVDGVLDMHNLMTTNGEWWKQTGDFTASPTDGHFNTAGNKKYAMALDAGFAPEREIGKGALAAYMKGKGL